MLAALLAWPACAAALPVDGRINGPEWADSQVFSDFSVTKPLTRAAPPQRTTLLVLPRADALYVGFRAEHAPAGRSHGRSPRDALQMDADTAILVIDFEGLGKTAYEFSVSLSGAQRDSIILNQSTQSTDWDGDWIAATREDPAGWTVTWRIPWSIAPEGAVHGDTRTLGIYAAREVKQTGQTYAVPAIEWLGANFVHDFRRIDVPRYPASSLDFYPYASVLRDDIAGSARGRAGIDIFWKPNGRNQLSAAINPDFGQVESDDVVVNFSAIETYYAEKRPFFTQGQQLFDLRLPQLDRLINTRRIGAAPDAGGEGAADVLAAGKYTGLYGSSEFGLFSAVERDSSVAAGRRFLAGRWRYATDSYGFGYLGTATEHPTLARDAFVHAVDFNLRPQTALSFTGQLLASEIRQRATPADGRTKVNSHGYGGWLQLDYQPGARWQESLSATFLDHDLNYNDLGYQQRAGILQLTSGTQMFTRKYPAGSLADNGFWDLEEYLPFNDRGEPLVAVTQLAHYFRWRNGASSNFWYVHEWSGMDDLLSRGNGSFRMPKRHNFAADYTTAAAGRLRFFVSARLREQGLTGFTRELQFNPRWFLTDNFSVGVELDHYVSPNWLVWRQGNQLAVYRRNELDTLLKIDWYPAPRQDLRLKLQWIGIGARSQRSYAIDTGHELQPIPLQAADFSVGTLALQVRYHYEFAPLSELFIVYSRGGDGSLDDRADGLASEFQRSISRRTADQLFAKIRYRF